MGKKYRVTPEGIRRVSDHPNASLRMFYRLVALQDIPEHGVKAGDLGGLITARVDLSQYGSCWVAQNARVSGNVVIDRSAYIGDEAVVTAGSKTRIAISNKVKIQQQAHVEAYHISYLPRINSVLHGNARIYGNAILTNPREISGDAHISENAVIKTGATIRDNAVISGSACIGTSAKIYGDTTITDNVEIQKGATVKDSSLTGSFVVPDKETIQAGKIVKDIQPHLSIELFSRKNAPNVEHANTQKPVEMQNVPESPLAHDAEKLDDFTGKISSVPRNRSVMAFDETMKAIADYEKDIVKIIKYPVMTDRTDSYTRTMVLAINKAKRYLDEPESVEFKEAVFELENAFLAAESNAQRIAGSLLNEGDKRSIQKAQDLFRLASNESSSEQEKKVAFIQGFKQLEGVIAVPEIAVDTFRVRIGLPELES